MKQLQFNNLHCYTHSTTIALTAIVVLFFLFSCGDEKKSTMPMPKGVMIPQDYTQNMEVLVSDSGRISYKIIAEEYKNFENQDPPFWCCEKGLYLEKYNDSLQIEATVESDTAYFYKNKELLELRSRRDSIIIKNAKDETFYTSQLFWDQKEEKIYTTRYIKIVQADQITEGIGFESDQSFENWVIKNPQGIYPVEE